MHSSTPAMCIIRTALTLLVFLSTANAFNASTGCGKALGYGIKKGGTGSSNTIALTSGGITRSFLLHIPTNYNINSARGLIFGYHGRGATASKQEVLSLFSDPYFNKDNLAVYPQGIDNQWQGDPEARTNDVQFTLDIIDYLAPRYCINQDAIFSTGKSNGGGFSLIILACDPIASTRIAAFASASGAYCMSLSYSSITSKLTTFHRRHHPLHRLRPSHRRPPLHSRPQHRSHPRNPRQRRRCDSILRRRPPRQMSPHRASLRHGVGETQWSRVDKRHDQHV